MPDDVTGDLDDAQRSQLGAWAVPDCCLPAVAHWMHDVLPNESYDPHFYGQKLHTTYFDTPNFDLRKARLKKDNYCTIRVRCYPGSAYALSAKTPDQKIRLEITQQDALAFLHGQPNWSLLPPSIFATLSALVPDVYALQPVVKVKTRRYAVENDIDRYTLDVHVSTDNGKKLPFNVLEYKSTQDQAPSPTLMALDLNPIKLSKFIWATEI